jgi:hypothetical protein
MCELAGVISWHDRVRWFQRGFSGVRVFSRLYLAGNPAAAGPLTATVVYWTYLQQQGHHQQ